MFHSAKSSDGLVCAGGGSVTPDSRMGGSSRTPQLDFQAYQMHMGGPPASSNSSLSCSFDTPSADWLYQLLTSAQLEQFYVRIRDQLQVSRLEHFDYVTCQDLEKVGLARPAAKRLMDLIKKRRRRAIMDKFIPSPLQNRLSGTKSKSFSLYPPKIGGQNDEMNNQPSPALTCLIQDKDVALQGTRDNFTCFTHFQIQIRNFSALLGTIHEENTQNF